MYEFLRGRCARRSPARLVLDVNGVGYDLVVPAGARFADEDPLQVWTHLAVREDAHVLYGFPEQSWRDLFRLLLKVKKVGPSMAIALLSGMEPEELVECIRAGDALRLTRVKGVGRKTADQILLDLSDQLDAWDSPPSTDGTPPASADGILAVAASALVSIGFSENDARKGVEAASRKVGTEDLELLIRTALRP
ncbi:Holliday junction branch migration protein RuvA [Engelhardtia mirabilis]|uniref:Holliday junction branch migration complex subunit RuvA n=1 Tax=Engelhardtia mirabilis TaxID=2528011 RepID=A0A518BLV6_9BACT|nr:Holliday junction ATP-dependent DNA helicase RuvA [Planctomycetes bacterium Pla133]QDV02295.1 Holliday junction ATP-dependent DNA helicase RuvA [Planctomycetes bacterium Pla86]